MFSKPDLRVKFSVIILGFTSIITQIVLIREFFSVFNGNELVTGIFLANWMLLTGAGAYFGKTLKKYFLNFENFSLSHFVIGSLPIITAVGIYYVRALILPPGAMANLIQVFLVSVIILAPFCLVSGLLFTIFANLLSLILKSNVISKVYAFEAIGSLAGGIIFNFLLIFILKTFFSLILLFLINCCAAIIQYYFSGKKLLIYLSTALCLFLTYVMISGNIEKKSVQLQFPNQELVHIEDTPFGKIVVTKSHDQLNFYENGNFLYSNNNVIQNEENVHYAMSQHPHPQKVLLISGGASGILEEILKYNIQSVDYIDQNKELVEIAELYTENIIRNKKIQYIYKDARLYLKQNPEKKYDVVLINLPDPTSVQINRYFTFDFFEELKNHLNEFAVLSMSLSTISNYMGEQSKKINSSIYSTLKLFFQNVTIIPGGKNYFIASNGHISTAIAGLIENRKIQNEYVNYYYLEDSLIARESKLIENAVSENVAINNDFKPVVYYFQLQYWLSYFKLNYIVFFSVLAAFAFLIILRLNSINFGLLVTGFSASALELVLIIAFQVIYGYTYQMIGIIITFFMCGLWLGSAVLVQKLMITKKTYSIMQYMFGLFSLLIVLSLIYLRSHAGNTVCVISIFIIMVSVLGLMTGSQYSISSKLRVASVSNIAASTYAADLLGSAIGIILFAVVFIPFFGIIKSTLFIAIINFLTGLFILIKSR
jgi:spermidine synthase